jgi:hypothetical protein
MTMTNRLPSLIATIISLMIDVYIFRSMQDIKKDDYECKCAKTEHVQKISNTIIVIISLQILLSIISLLISSELLNSTLISLTIIPILGVVGVQIYYLYLMISYLNDLKKHNCTCVNKTVTDVLFYYAWGRVILLVITFIMVLFAMWLISKMNSSQQLSVPQLKSLTKSTKSTKSLKK